MQMFAHNFKDVRQPRAWWFNRFKWLHWDQESKKVFCFLCIKAHQLNATRGQAAPAFINNGFNNWKSALDPKKGLKRHEISDCHKASEDKENMPIAT